MYAPSIPPPVECKDLLKFNVSGGLFLLLYPGFLPAFLIRLFSPGGKGFARRPFFYFISSAGISSAIF